MKRTGVVAALLSVFMLLVISCGSGSGSTASGGAQNASQSTETYKWKMQSSESSSSTFFKLESAWVEDVKKMTGGRIQIELLSQGAVVPVTNVLDATQAGILQLYSADPSYFAGKNPVFAMMGNLVGAWEDPWMAYYFMKFYGGDELYNKVLEPYGAHMIGSTFFAMESLVATKPLRGVDDFKGLKIRAPQGMVSDVMVKLGASPVNLPGSEVFTALQKGAIDAADYNSFAVNYAIGLYDMAKYTNYPGIHSLPMHEISISKKIWDTLPDDLKNILEVSIYKLNFGLIETLEYEDTVYINEAKASNKDIVISEWSEEERAKFRAVAREVWAEWAAKNELTKEYYEKVIAYLKERKLLKD